MALLLGFSDLFDQLGTDEVRYSAAAKNLSGHDVAIEGYLSHTHGPRSSLLLVDQPGVCLDCAAVAPAVITLCGAAPVMREGDAHPVRVVGRLDYGFRIDAGVASFLRIEQAAVEFAEAKA